MNFSKAKSFLIIMFIAVDIFLLYTLLINSSVNPFSKNDSYEKVVKLLQEKSVFIETEENLYDSSKIYNITLLNTASDRDKFLKNVLGEYKNNFENNYVSDKGTVSFKGDEFTFIPSNKQEFKDLPDSKETAKEVLTRLKKSGISTSSLKWISTVEEKKDLFRITYGQYFYDKRLLNSDFNVYITKEGIQRAFGGIYEIHSLDSENQKLKSKEEILLRFSNIREGTHKITINKIEEGYYNPKKEYRTFSVIPSMRITLKTGEIYHFDLSSGQLLENN